MAFVPSMPGAVPEPDPPDPELCSGGRLGRTTTLTLTGTGRLERRANSASYGPSSRRAVQAPERIAQADQGDASGNSEEPLVLRHDAGSDGCQRPKRQKCCSPAGENIRAEKCDPENEPSSQVSDPGDPDDGLHQPDITNRGAIVCRGDEVARVGRRTVSERGEDKRSDEFGPEHQQVPGGEQDVPEQAEQADLRDLAEVHPREAGESQGGHAQLQQITGNHVSGGNGGGVQVGVIDLDADEDQSC